MKLPTLNSVRWWRTDLCSAACSLRTIGGTGAQHARIPLGSRGKVWTKKQRLSQHVLLVWNIILVGLAEGGGVSQGQIQNFYDYIPSEIHFYFQFLNCRHLCYLQHHMLRQHIMQWFVFFARRSVPPRPKAGECLQLAIVETTTAPKQFHMTHGIEAGLFEHLKNVLRGI